jgi:hypothetical protein
MRRGKVILHGVYNTLDVHRIVQRKKLALSIEYTLEVYKISRRGS